MVCICDYNSPVCLRCIENEGKLELKQISESAQLELDSEDNCE